MPNTTPERIKAYAPHVARVSNETLLIAIEDAQRELAHLSQSHPDRERLERLLAVHYVTMGTPELRSYTFEGLSKTFATGEKDGSDGDLDGTKWGREAERILRRLRGPGVVLV